MNIIDPVKLKINELKSPKLKKKEKRMTEMKTKLWESIYRIDIHAFQVPNRRAVIKGEEKYSKK